MPARPAHATPRSRRNDPGTGGHEMVRAAARALLPLSASLVAFAAGAQQNPPSNPPGAPTQSAYTIPIGPSIGLEAAKKAAAAAAAEAKKNSWFMAIAVVD